MGHGSIIAASRERRASCDDGCLFDQFRDWVSGEWWSYSVIFAVSTIDAFFPLVPSESIVITAGTLASSGDLVLPVVIVRRQRRSDPRRQHLLLHREVGRRAHRQAALPLREGARRLRLGRTPARDAGFLHHRHRAVHPGRADGRHLLLRVYPGHDLAAVHRRGRHRGADLGDLRSDARLRRRQAVRGGPGRVSSSAWIAISVDGLRGRPLAPPAGAGGRS